MIVPQELPIQSRSSVLLSPKHDSEVNRLNNDSRLRTFCIAVRMHGLRPADPGYHPALKTMRSTVAAIKHNLNALFFVRRGFLSPAISGNNLRQVDCGFHSPDPSADRVGAVVVAVCGDFSDPVGLFTDQSSLFPARAGAMGGSDACGCPAYDSGLGHCSELDGPVHLHPRALATAAVPGGDRRHAGRATPAGGCACWEPPFLRTRSLASFGVSLCIFLGWKGGKPNGRWRLSCCPWDRVFQPSSDAWRQAASTRRFLFLGQWS